MDVTRPLAAVACSAVIAAEILIVGRLMFRRYRRWTD